MRLPTYLSLLTVRVLKCIAIAQSMTPDHRTRDSSSTAGLSSFCMLEGFWVQVQWCGEVFFGGVFFGGNCPWTPEINNPSRNSNQGTA